MTVWEILLIIAIVGFLAWIIGRHFYRKAKHLPTGDCSYCSSGKKGNKLLKAYHKKYGEAEEHCCCNHDSSCCCHGKEEDK